MNGAQARCLGVHIGRARETEAAVEIYDLGVG